VAKFARGVLRSLKIDTLLLRQHNSLGPLYVQPEKLNASSGEEHKTRSSISVVLV
jgi:hypothetical protein